jgi:hypothetical protein
MEGGLSYRLVRAILFGALAAQDRSTTMDAVDELMEAEGFNLCALAARALVKNSLPFKSHDLGELIPQPKP